MLWLYLGGGALVAGLAAGAAGGYHYRDLRADADDKARLEQAARDDARRAEHADRASGGYEAARVAAQTRERVVIREVQRVVSRPVYINECVDADGLRILAADIAAGPAAREPAAVVPATPRAD